MIEYKYKKIKGYEHKKFTENGHTMFETDVLQRLNRLAYLEVLKQQTKTTLDEMERFMHFIHDKIDIPSHLMETYGNMNANLANQIKDLRYLTKT